MHRVRIIFKPKTELNLSPQRLSVALHGFLMQEIEPAYADYLHQQSVNPYSTYVARLDEKTYAWEINMLTGESYQVFHQALARLRDSSFELKLQGGIQCQVLGLDWQDYDLQEASRSFYQEEAPARYVLHFESPTAFKQAGQYVIFPDIRLIYQSILLKYQAFDQPEEELDEEFLNLLVASTSIRRYRLQSQYLKVHTVAINGFVGSLEIQVKANRTLKNYIRYMLGFAEYSGVGIKASIGMGKLRLEEVDRREQR